MQITLEGTQGEKLHVEIWLRGNHRGKPDFDQVGEEMAVKEAAAQFLTANGGFNTSEVKDDITVRMDDLAKQRRRRQ